MKIFSINQSEFREFEDISQEPLVFLDGTKARERYKAIIAEAKHDYQDKGWEKEESNGSFRIYENGRYPENHFCITLRETDTEDEPDTLLAPPAGQEEVIDVRLSEAAFPRAYKNKIEELLEQGAFPSETEARSWLRQNPITLEIIYEKHSGLFAIESEAVATSGLTSPYTRRQITTLDD